MLDYDLDDRPLDASKGDEVFAFPTSSAQRRLWFLDRLEPGSAIYNIAGAFRLVGPLNRDALVRSIGEIVRRHETLRTTFGVDGDEPVQLIDPHRTVPVEFVDLSDIPVPQRSAEERRVVEAEAQRPFDLAKGPLLRILILRRDEIDHTLLIVIHHIVSDGWSLGILFRELAEHYRAYSSASAPSLPELPIQYADVAVWQRDWLTGEYLESQLAYWKRQLAGLPEALDLPCDKPRPAVRAKTGSYFRFTLPRDLADDVKQLGRREGATLFMTLLAAFGALLHRYTKCDDIPLGTPVAGRGRSEMEGLIGFFVNTLVLRIDLSDCPTFRELLGRVRGMALDAYAHQDLPFERLVEALRPERSLNRTPLFQVMFTVVNAPASLSGMDGLEVHPIDVDPKSSKFDLTLTMIEDGGSLRGIFEYSTELFEEGTISRMAGHYERLLEDAVARPDAPVWQLELLCSEERERVVDGFNTPGVEMSGEACLHEIFEAQARRWPDATAVVCGATRLSYAELNTRANKLAWHLRRLGVGPESRVGLYLDRSAETVVAVLGILKAGGGYVPLHEAYPPERLAFMLADAGATLLVTERRLADALPAGEYRRLCVDVEAPAIEQESGENPESGAAPHNLAYVIYTSGSTGKPKGVMVEHRNVTRLLRATETWFSFTDRDVWTLFHSYAFDFSVWELWGALAYGGRLVVVPYLIARSPDAFVEVVRSEGVTVLNQTPSAFQQFMRADELYEGGDALALRLVIFGGEALEPRSLRPWIDRYGDGRPRLINMYGITETTVHVTYRPILEDDVREQAASVIGRPIPDLQLYVLDEHLQPVPIGVPGELHVGGAGLARGYLARPDLTAAAFVANPFGRVSGSRLYRTGDLARFLPDGDVEYLGRIDHQVKIRGYRLELGEIESVLAHHPSVREAVVVAREERGTKKLVAYWVESGTDTASGRGSLSSELRRYLHARLPEYMVPAALVRVEGIPLTPNGKVDRRALPEPEGVREAASDYAAPRDRVERTIAEIWARVLGIERIGIQDNFFDLGGHSLLVVRIFGDIERAFDVKLPLATLFQAPTVGQLAAIIRAGCEPSWSSLVAIQPDGTRPPLFCMHAGGGNVLFYRPLAVRLGPDQPVYALQPQGLDGRQPRHTRVEDMAAHYLQEIRSVQPNGPYRLCGSSFGGLVALEIAQQLRARGEEVALLALLDTCGPGYPRLLPQTTVLRSKLFGVAQQVGHHLSSLALLERGERWPYVAEKARKAKKYALRWFLLRRKRALRAVYRALGRTFPRALQETQNALWQANQAYVPAPYDGSITLLRAAHQPRGIHPDPTLGWGDLARGGLEIYEVPGYHGSIVAEPNARTTAKVLRECLARAQPSVRPALDTGSLVAGDPSTGSARAVAASAR